MNDNRASPRIAWEQHGSGTPVVLLHGLGGSMADWAPQWSPFAARHQVIRLDVRGHGQSEKPAGPYQVADFAADVRGVLAAAGVERAHLVGLSMGGMIAFQLAVDAPDVVRSLVIVNSGPELRARNLAERFFLWQRRAMTRLVSMERLGAVLAGRLFPGPEHAATRAEFARRWGLNDRAAYRAALHAIIGWSVMDRLGALRCPVLAVHAEHDYSSRARKEEYVARIPGARLVEIAGTRHALPYEDPARFNDVVLEFLAGVDAGQGPVMV